MKSTDKPLTFERMVRSAKRITRDEFAANFGGIDQDVVAMLTSEAGQKARQEARDWMVAQGEKNLKGTGVPILQTLEFGVIDSAPELLNGDVAAVDGTFALPAQQYFLGQALCVAVGSVSYKRELEESLAYYSAKDVVDGADNLDDLLGKLREALFGMSPTAYLRFFEAQHALEVLEIGEQFVLMDGPITYEWLCHFPFAINLYKDLLRKKHVMGVIKDLANTKDAAMLGWALKPGEVLLYKTLAQHLAENRAANKNKETGAGSVDVPTEFLTGLASEIIRGVFKPVKKAFGFECHRDHLPAMLRILAADAQMNHLGHEIPALLNRVDAEIRAHYGRGMLKRQIAAAMAQQDEDLFFEASNERDFRD
jgi:hypothetical protein